MAKGWKILGSNIYSELVKETREEKYARDRRFQTAIRNLPKLNYEGVVKRGKESYFKDVHDKTQLIEAYRENKLKSGKLIKIAKKLDRADKKKALKVIVTLT